MLRLTPEVKLGTMPTVFSINKCVVGDAGDKQMRRIVLLVCFALSGLLCATPAFAAAETHDGFFLRFTPGLGYTSTSESVGSDSVGISGLGGMGGFGIGWSIVNNLVLHLNFASVSAINPKVSITSGGTTLSKDVSASETVTLFGLGASYYIMPANIYVGGSVGASSLSLTTDKSTTDSGTGWGLTLNAGKEWWVSDNWGLGVAGQFLFSSVPDKGSSSANLNTAAFGIQFSATYN